MALNNLQSGSNALLYHLNDLKGLSQWYERFGILGLSSEMIADCLKILGSLMLKTQELLAVIQSGLQSFIAFFRWLYLVILQLLDEEVPAFVKAFNQEDVSLIAEFLHCQLGQQTKGKTRFSMERVGQYLKKEPLQFQVDNSENIWTKFLDANPEMADTSYIFTTAPEKSLATLHDELTSSVRAAFDKLTRTTEQALSCNLRTPLAFCTAGHHDVSQISCEDGSRHWIAISESGKERLHLIRFGVGKTISRIPVADGVTVVFDRFGVDAKGQSRISVVDMAFYNETTLTLLLHREEENKNSSDILAQYEFSSLDGSQFKRLTSNETITTDGSEAIAQCRNLERMKAVKVAVSGSRKVACVLSTSRTRVKLFDMDADDEVDDTLDELQTSTMSTDSGV